MVMATPMLCALKAASDGEIWATGKPAAMYLYNGLDLFNRFIPYTGKGIVSFLDTVSCLREGGFGRGIVLPHSFRSALLLFLASVKTRIGYGRNNRGFMLTETVPSLPGGPEPTVEHYLRILDALKTARVVETPSLRVTEDEEMKFDDRFPDVGGNYVVFIVGAQYGPSKRWPDTHFSALADLLVERFPVRVYLLPGKGEEGTARRVYDGIKHKEHVEIRDMDIMGSQGCLEPGVSRREQRHRSPPYLGGPLRPHHRYPGSDERKVYGVSEQPYLCDKQGHTLQAVQSAPLRQGPRVPEKHQPGGGPWGRRRRFSVSTRLEPIERFREKRICVVGDVIADVYIYGKPHKLSREAPVLVIKYEEERVYPGSAGNTIANLLALGAYVFPVTCVGNDAARPS